MYSDPTDARKLLEDISVKLHFIEAAIEDYRDHMYKPEMEVEK